MNRKKVPLRILIETQPNWATGALLKLYSYQTDDEQNNQDTIHNNSIGFNNHDAERCSSMARFLNSRGFLTEPQIRSLQRILPKYSGQLERSGGITPFTIIPIKKPEVKKEQQHLKQATMEGKEIRITFPYNPDTIAQIKTLPNRKWNSTKKHWSASISIEAIEKLIDMGFYVSRDLKYMLENSKIKLIKLPIDFYLCPLYNIFNGVRENKKEAKYAKRNLPKNTQSIKSSKEKFSKREDAQSKKKSSQEIKENSRKTRMEKESIGSNQKSYAQAGNKRKTFKGIKTSEKKTWYKLQRGEWAGINSYSEISKQIIIPMWLYNGIPNPDQTCQTLIQKCTHCIQNGLRESNTKNSNRIRRSKSSYNEPEKKRQEKRQNSENPWMECSTLKSLQTFKIIPGIKKPLYPFQLEDTLQIENLKGRILIGSEMGLGKTIQALAWLQMHPELRPVVIVCPASVKLNWKREIQMWMPTNITVQVLSGKSPSDIPLADILIINYDIIDAWSLNLITLNPKVIILDEGQYIKNKNTLRTKAVKKLCKNVPHIMVLTGTPIVNRPIEMFNALNLIAPEHFPSWWAYAKRYCDLKSNGFGWDFNGATNTAELHEKLTSSIMIRRLKENVLKDLPAKTRTVLPIELSNQKEYDKAQKDLIGWLKEVGLNDKAEAVSSAEQLVKFEYLKQLCVKGKLKKCKEWIRDFIETGEKLVIFATHKFVIKELMDEFGDIAVKLDGSTSLKQRQENIESFQTDPHIKLFIGNIKAAGVGITLTAASNSLFLELPWVPGELDQAEDRIHRIGQEAEAVNIWYLLAAGTIEEEIAELLDSKRQVIAQIIDGKEDVENNSLLADLLQKYKSEN